MPAKSPIPSAPSDRQSGSDRAPGVILPDAEFERHKTSLNNALHELVFACEFMEQGSRDDLPSALDCLTTALGAIDQVSERLTNIMLLADAAKNPQPKKK